MEKRTIASRRLHRVVCLVGLLLSLPALAAPVKVTYAGTRSDGFLPGETWPVQVEITYDPANLTADRTMVATFLPGATLQYLCNGVTIDPAPVGTAIKVTLLGKYTAAGGGNPEHWDFAITAEDTPVFGTDPAKTVLTASVNAPPSKVGTLTGTTGPTGLCYISVLPTSTITDVDVFEGGIDLAYTWGPVSGSSTTDGTLTATALIPVELQSFTAD